MPSCQTVNIEIADGEQFEVRVGSEVRAGDLYYLGIDPRTKDHGCTYETGLMRLIDGWLTTIIQNDANCLFYLPFDFSDEFTRWLACEKSGDEITVVFGWAEVEGWSFSPSDFRAQSRSLTNFRADEPANPQTFYTPRFLSELRRCRMRLISASS